MIYYGLKSRTGDWMTDDSGIVFSTPCLAVAIAQYKESEKWNEEGVSSYSVAIIGHTDDLTDKELD